MIYFHYITDIITNTHQPWNSNLANRHTGTLLQRQRYNPMYKAVKSHPLPLSSSRSSLSLAQNIFQILQWVRLEYYTYSSWQNFDLFWWFVSFRKRSCQRTKYLRSYEIKKVSQCQKQVQLTQSTLNWASSNF